MKTTKKDIFEIASIILGIEQKMDSMSPEQLRLENVSSKFKYSISNIFKLLENEYESLRKTLFPERKRQRNLSEEEKRSDEFDQKRQNLNIEMCDKDSQGNPIIRRTDSGQTGYAIATIKVKEFAKKIQELESEYKDIIEIRQNTDEENEKILNETIQIETDLYKFDESLIPSFVTLSQVRKLFPFLTTKNDKPEEKPKPILP